MMYNVCIDRMQYIESTEVGLMFFTNVCKPFPGSRNQKGGHPNEYVFKIASCV